MLGAAADVTVPCDPKQFPEEQQEKRKKGLFLLSRHLVLSLSLFLFTMDEKQETSSQNRYP